MRVSTAAIFKFFFVMTGRSQPQIRKLRTGKSGEKPTPLRSANRSQALNPRKLAEQDALRSCPAWGILFPSSREYYVPQSLPSNGPLQGSNTPRTAIFRTLMLTINLPENLAPAGGIRLT